MVFVDRVAPIRFLRTAYDSGDWVAVFLKTYRTGEVAQRVLPLSTAASPHFQAWLRHKNAKGWNVYVSVNAVLPGCSRTRRSIAAVRHVFLEEDVDGPTLLAALATRGDLPPPSYVLHSSPGRLHILWRTRNFGRDEVEALQKRLSRELHTDSAATSCAQTTRLPGFVNHKHERPWSVRVEFLRPAAVLAPEDFPLVASVPSSQTRTGAHVRRTSGGDDRVNRARRFLQSVEPAVAGQHGDLRTFRVCCRVVRGFDLTADEAVEALQAWNARCEPPWSERELLEKVKNAGKYGHEPYGCLLR